MIKVLRDVVGMTEVNKSVVIPFTISNVSDKPMKLEAIIYTSDDEYVVKQDWVRMLGLNEEIILEEVTKEHEDAAFIVRINLEQVEAKHVYIRMYNSDTSYVSHKIYIAKSGGSTITTKPIELDFRPRNILINDEVDCTANNVEVEFDTINFVIEVMACNNATSNNPVWENMTQQYLARQPFEFTNNIKDNDKTWAVSVRYEITKMTSNSTLELSDIKLTIL